MHKQYELRNSQLHCFEGDILQVLASLQKFKTINSIACNLDYSPYSKQRDAKIAEFCKANQIKFIQKEDLLLADVLDQLDGKPAQFFSSFKRSLRKNFEVRKSDKTRVSFEKIQLESEFLIPKIEELEKFYERNDIIFCHGGRMNAIECLNKVKFQDQYKQKRNFLNYQTTGLSPYINLGLLSIREVYEKCCQVCGKSSKLVNELWWRDFYYYILHHFPKNVGNNMNPKFQNIPWDNNLKNFEKWKNGQTGFPIVDACMSQLNQTGYMHNRGRMIVASFLTKHLFTDWKWGEKYFASKLIDSCVAANNGGWQWSASTGGDIRNGNLFRIFNPWLQVEKFDHYCEYVKKWLPVLKSVPNQHLLKWERHYPEYKGKLDYPEPMCNHLERRKYALDKFKLVVDNFEKTGSSSKSIASFFTPKKEKIENSKNVKTEKSPKNKTKIS